MPRLQYGATTIDWVFRPDDKLKRHYVTVERGRPVLLRGPRVDAAEQEALVRRRARWIRSKQALVNQVNEPAQVITGSRLRYGGRSYFTEVRQVPGLSSPALSFTASRFIVDVPKGQSLSTEMLQPLLVDFYRQRAQDRLPARVRHWERMSGLSAQGVLVKPFQSRWASCDAGNVLAFHPRVMALPASVQEYVVVHELCHTVEKGHTKAFWALVAHLMPQWCQHHEYLERAAYPAHL